VPKVTVRLSDESWEGYQFIERQGVTLTGFLEAIGCNLKEGVHSGDLADVLERARQIDLERRTRRPDV
jgi:hypothetical protein